MKKLLQIILSLSVIIATTGNASSQEKINVRDKDGNKQGHWIKKYPDGSTMYEGYFVDDKPRGELKRYDQDGKLSSVLEYSNNNDTVTACFYHPNGFIAGKGKYIDRKKTGAWLYYSDYIEGHLLMRCTYRDDLIEGMRLKYHWNGEIAEKLEFENGVKSGAWKQYFTDGTLSLQATYINGKLNGEFRSWHTNGKQEITGSYIKDLRNGRWLFYNTDGTVRKEIIYNYGIPENRAELIREESEYLDRLEKEGGKISDPEISGIIW
ncbi:MAG: hypothetical protein KFF49_01510 [Bacteroidales bacterium]|nr:hypothetical protein [Bacteroidales bacterium]